MLWERDKLRFDSLLPEQIPEGTNLGNELRHYGVPGMHWGEITQEKVLNAGKRRAAKRWSPERTSPAIESSNNPYSKRYKNTSGSVQKSGFSLRKQYRTFKAQNQQEGQDLYKRMYERGKQVGKNSWVYDSAYKRAKEKYDEAHPQPDIVDRAVTRLASEYGLERFAPAASSALKNLILQKGMEFLRTKKGQQTVNNIAKKSTNAMGFLLDKGIKSYDIAKPYAKEGIKATGRGLSALGKISIKAGKRTIDWINNGQIVETQAGQMPIDKLLQQFGKQSAKALRSSLRTGALATETAARTGERSLRDLLRRSQNGRRG